MPTYATGNLLVQAQQHVAQQLDDHFKNTSHTPIERYITVMSPRGAALHSCPSGWEWEPLNLHHWSRVHIGVKCQGRAGSLVALVQAKAPLWVSAHNLPQGHRLQAQDIKQQVLLVGNTEDINNDLAWLGRTLRKPLTAGTALHARHLTVPVYARKGDKVEIRASVEGITVSVAGIATRTGYEGDIVRVRNLSSQQWVTGRLTAPGVLEPTEPPRGGVKVQLSD